MTKRSLLHDRKNSFGWISIGFHWSSALVITLLWFIGSSISLQTADAMDARRTLHITIGLIFWMPLLLRVLWRVVVPHPRAPGQTLRSHQLACAAHYLMLLVVLVMLFSGPLLAGTLSDTGGKSEMLYMIHANAARVLVVLVILHILAAMKHLMFHDDETIARIFVPRRVTEDIPGSKIDDPVHPGH